MCDGGDVLVSATMHRLGSAVARCRGEEEEEEVRGGGEPLTTWAWLVWAWPAAARALARTTGCKPVAELPLSDLLACRAPLVLSQQALRTDLPFAPEVDTRASIRALLRRAGAVTGDDGHGDLFAERPGSHGAAADVETDHEDVFARGGRPKKAGGMGVQERTAAEGTSHGGWLRAVLAALGSLLLLAVALLAAAVAAEWPLPPLLLRPLRALLSAAAGLV